MPGIAWHCLVDASIGPCWSLFPWSLVSKAKKGRTTCERGKARPIGERAPAAWACEQMSKTQQKAGTRCTCAFSSQFSRGPQGRTCDRSGTLLLVSRIGIVLLCTSSRGIFSVRMYPTRTWPFWVVCSKTFSGGAPALHRKIRGMRSKKEHHPRPPRKLCIYPAQATLSRSARDERRGLVSRAPRVGVPGCLGSWVPGCLAASMTLSVCSLEQAWNVCVSVPLSYLGCLVPLSQFVSSFVVGEVEVRKRPATRQLTATTTRGGSSCWPVSFVLCLCSPFSHLVLSPSSLRSIVANASSSQRRLIPPVSPLALHTQNDKPAVNLLALVSSRPSTLAVSRSLVSLLPSPVPPLVTLILSSFLLILAMFHFTSLCIVSASTFLSLTFG